MLRVEADLSLEIDGRRARLRNAGELLILELETAALLRDLLRVERPDLHALFGIGRAGGGSPRRLPALLAGQGLTVEVHDRRGPLLILGAGAAGREVSLPLLGRVEHVALASAGAALRLALNA